MPQLGRGKTRLLRTVKGQEHATNADYHADSLPTPPASNEMKNGQRRQQEETEEDINRDPDSSSDEETQALPSTDGNGLIFQHPRQFDGVNETSPKAQGFRIPTGVQSPESTRSNKRGSEGEISSGSEDAIFGSSQASRPSPSKRHKSAGALGNIHTVPSVPRGRQQTYGKSNKKRTIIPPGLGRGLQQSNAGRSLDKKPEEQRPKFQMARGRDMFAFGQDNSSAAGFKTAKGAESASRGSSPSLDELSSADSDIEEVDVSTLGLPAPEPYVPTENCEICGLPVPRLLRQEFEDRYTGGKAMSYKWQERFCRYHKVDSARQAWTEQCYPEIDWLKLNRRMKRHDKHLEAILTSRTSSFYRDQLQAKVKSGKMKTTYSALSKNDQGKDREVAVGYYGPRGEKLMTDHIITHFGDELRALATDDPLLKASGVAGGVSGFVQAVLVPELAVKLVMEDMKIDSDKARELLIESADVGEFVNDEASARIKDVEAEAEEGNEY